MQNNIPTVQPVKSTKAVFAAQDVQNSFERDIAARHDANWNRYLKDQQKRK